MKNDIFLILNIVKIMEFVRINISEHINCGVLVNQYIDVLNFDSPKVIEIKMDGCEFIKNVSCNYAQFMVLKATGVKIKNVYIKDELSISEAIELDSITENKFIISKLSAAYEFTNLTGFLCDLNAQYENHILNSCKNLIIHKQYELKIELFLKSYGEVFVQKFEHFETLQAIEIRKLILKNSESAI